MRRTLFEMGFSSPVQGYGPVQPSLGLKFSDISNLFKATSTPLPTTPIVAPAPAPTILGMDQNTFLMLGAVLLGGGLLIAVLASRKKVEGAPASSKK
jgi:hypothetical protein